MTRGNVCITGIGAATPLGSSYAAIAANLLDGKSGVRKVTGFPIHDHPSQIAAEVDGIPCPASLSPREEFSCLGKTVQALSSCGVR